MYVKPSEQSWGVEIPTLRRGDEWVPLYEEESGTKSGESAVQAGDSPRATWSPIPPDGDQLARNTDPYYAIVDRVAHRAGRIPDYR